MDEKYFKVVDKMISQGKSSDYILQVLNMQQAGVSEGDLAAYMELKKKDSGSGEQGSTPGPSTGSSSVSEDSESTLGFHEAFQLSGEQGVRMDEVVQEKIEDEPDGPSITPDDPRFDGAKERAEEAKRSGSLNRTTEERTGLDYEDYFEERNLEENVVLNDIWNWTESKLNEVMPETFDKLVNSGELQQEVARIKDRPDLQIGQTFIDYGEADMIQEPGAPFLVPDSANAPQYYVDADFRADKVSQLRNYWVQEKANEFLQTEFKDQVKAYVKEKHPDLSEDALEALTDKMYYEFGINVDLDDDNKINEQPWVQDFVNSVGSSTRDLFVGAVQLVAGGINEVANINDRTRAARNARLISEAGDFGPRNTTVFTGDKEGMLNAFGNGNYGAGFWQLGTGIGEVIPQTAAIVGSTMIGQPNIGLGLVVAAGGGGAYAQAALDPNSTGLSRLAYAGSAMGIEFVGGRILQGITKGSSKWMLENISRLERRGLSRQVLNSGRRSWLHPQAVRGVSNASQLRGSSSWFAHSRALLDTWKATSMRLGMGSSTEAAEEGIAYAFDELIAKPLILGQESDFNLVDLFEQSILGGFGGAMAVGGGFAHGNSVAGARSRANANALDIRNLERRADELEVKAQEATNEAEKRGYQRMADSNRLRAHRMTEANVRFYDMLQLRHPELFEAVQKLDQEINAMSNMIDQNQTPDTNVDLESELNKAVQERQKLVDSVASESVILTDQENETKFDAAAEAQMNQLDLDVAQVEAAADDMMSKMQRGEATSDAVDQAFKVAEQARQKRSEVKALIEQHNEIKEQLKQEDVDPEVAADLQNQQEDIRQELSQKTGVAAEAFGSVSEAETQIEGEARLTQEWLDGTIEVLENSSLSSERIREILDGEGDFAMLTAENPNAKTVSEGKNTQFNRMALRWLVSRGYEGKIHRIVGKYDAGENSFLVEDMTIEDSIEFAKKFGQESVAHRTGLVQADGSINLFEGKPVYHETNPDNFFSVIKDTEGNQTSFSFIPSDQYMDADGNTITGEEYTERSKQNARDFSDIEAAIQENPVQEEGQTEQKEGVNAAEDGYVTVRTNSDGSSAVVAGQNGVETAAEAKAINNLTKLVKALFGDNVEVRIYQSQDAADAVEAGSWGGLFTKSDGKRVIHINPQAIRENARLEGEEFRGALREKSFKETLQEEVMHSVIGASLFNLYMKSPRLASRMENLVMKLSEKENLDDGSLGLRERIRLKKAQYGQEANTQKEKAAVFEETVIEFLSAYAANPDRFQFSQVDKFRIALNKMLVDLYGAMGKTFQIDSVDTLLEIGKKFSAAQERGETFRFDVEEAGDKRASEKISPTRIPTNENGKITVKMQETFYKYDIGFKKDIGSDEVTKEFNDVWHFINWWKKATKMGEDQHFFSFETADGTPIDVERIKNYKSRRSDRITSVESSKQINSMISDAVSQKIISPVVAARIRNKIKRTLNKMSVMERNNRVNSDRYKREVELVRRFEENTEQLIQKEARAKGKEFIRSGMDDVSRASHFLRLDLMGQLGTDEYMTRRAKIKDSIQSLTGINLNRVKNKLEEEILIRQAIMNMPEHVPPGYSAGEFGRYNDLESVNAASKLADLAMYYTGERSSEVIKEVFEGENPIKFFENYHEAATTRVKELIESGRLDGTVQDNMMRLHFIMAFTSAQNRANPNVEVAMQILELANKDKGRRGAHLILPQAMIDSMKKRGTFPGFDKKNLIPGHTLLGARNSFNKLNALIQGDLSAYSNKQIPATVKDALVRATGTRGNFIDDNGNVMWDSVMKFLLSPYEGSRVRKTGTVMAQELFSPKLGAWALNLSQYSMPDLSVADTKLSDVLTIDSHVMRTMSMLLGSRYGLDIEMQIEANIEKLAGWLIENLPTQGEFGKRRRSLKSNMSSYGRIYTTFPVSDIAKRTGVAAIDIARDYLSTISDADTATKLEGLLSEAINPTTKFYADDLTRTRQIIAAVSDGEMTPSQFGQLLFADSQVSTAEILKGKALTSKYETYASAIKALPKDEVRASSRLTRPLSNGDATESPLYRQRTLDEASKVRPNLTIDDEAVMEALSTDATSRRIMAKDSQISEGQQVGVRLNLNVMKNTGVPVQTMHDKTASGEALRYAAAVTVKNPTLYVNQNARRKILTFQENKFPMASVNGEFLTDKLKQTDFNGVKAFFNPFKHNVFVDASGRPIKSADEATIIGSAVYLRGNIEYYDFNDPILFEGRTETEAQKEKRIKRGPKYDKALKRFAAYSSRMGVEFANQEDLMEAYDNMPIASQVAMSESEVVNNMEEAQKRASIRLRLRQTAGRASRTYQGETRKAILNNPNNYFTPQVLKQLKQQLGNKTDAELIDIMTDDGLGRLSQRNDDLGVLAAAEMINRAVANGDMDAIPDLIEEAAAMGTTAGRILRHLRELRGSTPKGIEMVILKEVERRGNSLSDEQKSRLQKMAAEIFRLGAEHEELMKRAIAGEDVEAELKEKTKEYKQAERNLETFANAVIERGWGQIGGLLIQGNLLTPMSQITNVGANMVNALGKVAVDALALPIERLVNVLGIDSPMKRNYSINAYIHGIRRFGVGFMEALDQIKTGQEADVTEWRMARGFAPVRSLMSAMGKGDLPLGPDGKVSLNTRAKLFVQGTLGIPAEIMFRFLSLGDTPFRRYVEGIELYQIGKSQGLEGEALKNFLKFPTKQAMEMAEAEGKKLTYQEETIASRTADDFVKFVERMTARFFDWIPGTDGNAIARFLIRSNIPYRRTPANILYDTLTFATPYVAIPRMMAELRDGDARSASQTLAKSMIGGMATQVTLMMIREGLISGAIEWNEDEERNMAYDQFPPNSINISALNRWINGESTAKQEDDYFISYMKLGIIGTVMGSVVKGVDRAELKKRDYSGDKWASHIVQDAFGIQAFSSIAHMMDQSFVQGMNNFIQVISTGDERTWENWLGTTFQAMSATVLPNTMTAFYRAERDYLPDSRITKDMGFAERVLKKFEYTIKSRTFGLGELPIRRNWKGEKIEQTPRGTNGIAYQLFDITKARQGEADAVSNEIWRLFEQTEDLPQACGTPGYAQKRKINVPNIRNKHLRMLEEVNADYTWVNDEEFMAEALYLNTNDLNRLMEASGKERYMEIEKLMATEEYNAMDDFEKVEALNDLNGGFNGAIEINNGQFRNHTMVLFDIMQEKYEQR